jgi:two-component system CheB/CheR fusion protein
MQTLGIQAYEHYIDYLEVHPEEFSHLFNTILINVTGFFRDEAAWEFLQSDIIPRLVDAKGSQGMIRIWSAGCASGEEAYTLAIILAEALGVTEFRDRVKIYATDLDEEALNYARQGSYAAKEVANIPPDLLAKYFEDTGQRYVFHRDLRRAVIFGRHDLLQDAPISRIDLLSCRNTLMYFNSEAQTKILSRFHFALDDSGYLFLGKAEMLFVHANLFVPVELKRRIFTKVAKGTLRDRLLIMAQTGSIEDFAQPPALQQTRIHEAAFHSDPLAQMVIDYSGSVVLLNEQARSLFGLTLRDIGRPLQDLELSYRPVELRSGIDQAYNERHVVTLKDVEWRMTQDDVRLFDIQIVPLIDNHSNPLGAKIIFVDVTRFKQLQNELQQSKQELEMAYEELQSSNEELVTTNEELQSTVEELETTNEELQSTNEELETMNEELQSTNEELQTINEELRQQGDELNQVNSFLESILGSLRGGVVVINRNLNIQVWNHRSEDLWGLRADEAYGQHLLNLDIGLPVESLKQPIRACLAGEEVEGVLLPATNRRGKGFTCKVTLSPLAGVGGDIRGVILLMEDQQQYEQ